MRHFVRFLGQRLVVRFERGVGIGAQVELVDPAERLFRPSVTIMLTSVSFSVTTAI
jgi:hypothetical protein